MAETSGSAALIGLALILAQVIWKLIDTKLLKNGNGNGYNVVGGFSATDRETQTQILDVMKEQTIILRQFTGASLRYFEKGADAMASIGDIEEKVDETREHLLAFTNQLSIANTNTNNALAGLLSNDREQFTLLREIRDRQK